MAAKFDVDSKKSDLHSFYPQDVNIKAQLNGRTELPDIDWLVCSILEQGQLQACVIRKDGDKPTLGLGFSRWRAVSFINELVADEKKRDKWVKAHTELEGETIIRAAPFIPAEPLRLRCEFKQWSEMEMFIANIHENQARNPTTNLDDAYNCQRLEKWGKSQAEIAAIYRKSTTWVKDRLQIVSAEPEVLKAVKDHRLKLTAVKAIAKLTADQQRNKVKGEGPVKIERRPNEAKVELKEKEASVKEFEKRNQTFYKHCEKWKESTSNEALQLVIEMISQFHAGDCEDKDVLGAISKID